ncbi:MAG: hypothetical protein ABI718_07585 [Acidobacteriota bacterium]
MNSQSSLSRKLSSAILLASLAAVPGCRTTIEPPHHGRLEITEREDQPDAAEEYERAKRLRGAEGIDPRAAYERARLRAAAMPRYSITSGNDAVRSQSFDGEAPAASGKNSWQSLGPGNIGGRTRTLLIDPTNSSILYAAGVSGGVWKSIDRGDHWNPIGDELTNIAVNVLAFDPQDARTIYAGTGEGYFREDVRGTGLPLRGGGIFVSRDEGVSWSRLESTATPDFFFVNDLFVSGSDSMRLYAATRSGVWRSPDGGNTWQRLLDPGVKGGCLDLAARTDIEGDYLFASCGTLDQATIYRQPHAEGDSVWQPVLSAAGMGRTSLAVAASSQNVVYALSASNANGQALLAIFRSDSSGDAGTWIATARGSDADPVNSTLLTNAIAAHEHDCFPEDDEARNETVNMGWYSNVIAVDPTNPDRLWAGGVDVFRSDDGGRRWTVSSYWWGGKNDPAFAHADLHAIVFDPGFNGGSNTTLYVANDGGIFRTDVALAATGEGLAGICNPDSTSVSWRSLDHGYGVTQFYHGVVFPDGRSYFGGAQDNGTIAGNDGSPDNWIQLFGGDGTYSAIDTTDPKTIYVQYQWGALMKSQDGGKTFDQATRGLSDRGFLFVTPLAMDPVEPKRLWIGGQRLWRTTDGAAEWTAASALIPQPAGSISAITVAPGQSNRVLAGTSQGTILRSDSALSAGEATAWESVMPRSGWISSISFQPTSPDIVYATYAGFGGAHVWRSLDGGRAWASIDGTGEGLLPDLPVHSLVVDPFRPDRLFIGTDLGVFVSADSGGHWYVEGDGLPNVVTEWLTTGASPSGQALYAFTHGRGAWRIPLDPAPLRRRARR